MLIENLVDFGLSGKEAKVYVAVLELEVATANEIAEKSGVNRGSVYMVIESLKKQGLVSMIESGNEMTKQYVVTPPEVLLNMARKKAEKYEGVRKMIEDIVPSLEALHKDTKHKPKVFMYDGKENVKDAYYRAIELDRLNPKDYLRLYENSIETDKYMPGFIEADCLERKRRGVEMRAINPDTANSRELVARYKEMESPDEILLVPIEKFKPTKSGIDFGIYGDEVSFSSLQESFLIVIKHQQIADTLKNIFDLAWEEAKRLGKKY